MALTIAPEILGQVISGDYPSYCYLYEPFRISVLEDNILAVKIYVDIEQYNIETGELVNSYPRYGEFDINSLNWFNFDLMEMTRQLHESNIYKMSTVQALIDSGGYSIISKYFYRYLIYTDKTEAKTIIRKTPIIGGRDFQNYNPTVRSFHPITEFQKYGINEEELANRWKGYTFLKATLTTSVAANLRPTVTKVEVPSDTVCEAGVLIWKSSLGGWMFWGFDLNRKVFSHNYTGQIDAAKFRSDNKQNGSPYVEVNYSAIDTSYTIELKALSLSQNELKAVAGISASPAVYYTNDKSGRLELMRLASVNVPLSNLADGGDFSVTLDSISTNSQKTL